MGATDPSPPGRVSGRSGTPVISWLLYAALATGFCLTAFFGRRMTLPMSQPFDRSPALPPAQHRVNPNTAQWWELAVLPGIGERGEEREYVTASVREPTCSLPKMLAM